MIGEAELGPLEIASGYPVGVDAVTPPLPGARRRVSTRDAIEEVVREALEREPCLVSFSGGRDSSAVLAVAVHVARKHGLLLPVPITQRFPDVASTEESSWQERVVAHLGLEDWIRLEIGEELDALGAIATGALARHGVLWPPNVHTLTPALEAARGGALLTGVGGDQLLDPGRNARLAAVLTGRARPRRRDLLRLGVSASPPALRRRVRRRRDPPRLDTPWLRPDAIRAVEEQLLRESTAEPVRRDVWVAWLWRLRPIRVGIRSMSLLAADAGARVVHPFFSPEAFAALGAEGRRRPFRDRTDAMTALFGDLLPHSVCERRSKASFDAALWNRAAQAFVQTVAADEVDSELVDGEAAVAFWTRPRPGAVSPFRSLTLLHSTWLARRRQGSTAEPREEHAPGGVEAAPVLRAAERERR